MNNMETSTDEKSKRKAYELFESGFVDNIEVVSYHANGTSLKKCLVYNGAFQ